MFASRTRFIRHLMVVELAQTLLVQVPVPQVGVPEDLQSLRRNTTEDLDLDFTLEIFGGYQHLGLFS